MNKQGLVDFVASELGQSKKSARDAVNVVVGGIMEGLLNEGKVSLVGFGTFELVKRPARTARNPKTSEVIEVPEKMVPKFRASRSLKEMVMDLEFVEDEEAEAEEAEVEAETEQVAAEAA